MIKHILVKSVIAAGITIWAIPFLSAVLVGLMFVALLWIKEKAIYRLFSTPLN